MAKGVNIFVFYGGKDGSRANAINHELNAFVHGIDGRDGKCDELGDWGEVGGWVSGCKEGLDQSGNCWWKRCSLGFIWGKGVDGHGGGDRVVVGVEVFDGV